MRLLVRAVLSRMHKKDKILRLIEDNRNNNDEKMVALHPDFL